MRNGAPKPLILVDMDNTVVSFDDAFIKRWRELDPQAEESLIRERQHFELEENLPPELRPIAEKIMASPGFYASFEPLKGAVEALQAMVAQSWEVRLCTAPHPLQWEDCVRDKYAWVREHLGAEWLHRIIIVRDKTCVRGSILVDDKPAVTGFYPEPEWAHVVFDQPYNRDAQASVRLQQWSDWRRVLGPLLQAQGYHA
jgi:5'-nucleotidase